MSVAAVKALSPSYAPKKAVAANAPMVESHRHKIFKKMKAVVLNPDTPLWLGNVGSIARSVEQLVAPFFTTAIKVKKFLAGTQFISVLNAPFNIYEVATGFVKLIREKGKENKVDNGLELLSNIGQLSEDVGGIASAFKDLNLVTSSLAWLTPLSIFSTIASTVTYIMDGRSIYFCSKLLSKTKAKYANNLQGLIKKHAYHLERQGGVDVKQCNQVLEQIKAAPEKNQQNEQLVLKAINKRIKTRQICQALSIVITTISIIATAIFLLASAQALLIAAAALVIALSVISMARRGLNLYSNYRFEKKLTRIKFAY